MTDNYEIESGKIMSFIDFMREKGFTLYKGQQQIVPVPLPENYPTNKDNPNNKDNIYPNLPSAIAIVDLSGPSIRIINQDMPGLKPHHKKFKETIESFLKPT